MDIIFTNNFAKIRPYYFHYGDILAIFLSSIALSLVIGIILYSTFMKDKNEDKYSGFLEKCYLFFTFKTFIFDKVIRFIYIVSALFLTIYGLMMLFIHPIFALGILILGNLGLRMTTEFLLSIFMIKDSGCKLDISDEYFCDSDEELNDDTNDQEEQVSNETKENDESSNEEK